MKKFIYSLAFVLIVHCTFNIENCKSQTNPLLGTWNKLSGPGDPIKYTFVLGSKAIIQFVSSNDTANYLNTPIYLSSLRNLCLGKDGIGSWQGVYKISNDTLIIEGYWYTGQPTVPTPTVFNSPTTYKKVSIGIKNISTEIPEKYSLSQNYPNPFNPTTNIRYQITNTGFVKLIVFDALGREVETLVNEKQSAGTFEVTFDGSNLTSGVYFYRLQTDGFSDVKKMVLMK